jgi:hypothetical protein
MQFVWSRLNDALKNPQTKERLLFYLGGIVVFLLMPLASGWIVNATGELFVHEQASPEVRGRWAILIAIGLVLLIVGLFIARSLYERLVPPKVEVIKGPPPKRKVVIAFLSTIGNRHESAEEKIKENVDEQGMRGWQIKDDRGEPVFIRTLHDWVINHATKKLTSWQQLARSIFYHWNDGPLELAILITSKTQNGRSGSEAEAPHACKVFEDLLNAGNAPNRRVRVVVPSQQGIDFEDLNEVMNALEKAIALARREGYSQDEDMVIDVTGGQKTTSIAGALKTLDRRDLIFQYIPTDTSSAGLPRAYKTTTAASSYS